MVLWGVVLLMVFDVLDVCVVLVGDDGMILSCWISRNFVETHLNCRQSCRQEMKSLIHSKASTCTPRIYLLLCNARCGVDSCIHTRDSMVMTCIDTYDSRLLCYFSLLLLYASTVAV